MINTVLGKIKTEDLGKTLIHEHLYCGSPHFFRSLGDRWFDRAEFVKVCTDKLTEAKNKFGLCTVVDASPSNLGRDISLLVEVSEKSGVNIVASSGLYYGEEPCMNDVGSDYLSDLLADECKRGAENTYKTDNPVFPGILKSATGYQGFTPLNINYLITMAKTQAKTGLSLFSHNEHYMRTAHRQLDIFEANGADLSKVIIGHASDCYDIDYLETILDRGVFLGFDRLYSAMQEKQAQIIKSLITNGWKNKILLSGDKGAFVQFSGRTWETERVNTFNQYAYVVDEFYKELLKNGVVRSDIEDMLCENTKNVLDMK